MSKLTGKGLADFCKTKLGTPYVYGAKGSYGKLTQAFLNILIHSYTTMFTNIYIVKAKRFIGKVCTDCSGLPGWYTGKNLGSYQLYKTASERHPISAIAQAPIGAILWEPGHVGVYIGKSHCIEAKGIDYGTVESKVSNTKFTHWLLFDYIDYEMPVSSNKEKNPYKEPVTTVQSGCIGDNVHWVQWELNDAGIEVDIDGEFGPATNKAVKTYQQSCKIKVDGEVGPATIKAFKAD